MTPQAEEKKSSWSLFKNNVVTQSILAILVVGTICIMALRGQEVSVQLAGMAMLILGFFFGAKVQNDINNKK